MVYVAQEAFPGFTFGCDPELFITDDRGRYVSAEGLIPGTKEEPYPVECGAVQVDGMAAEFNTNPAKTFEEFDTNIKTVIRQLKSMLPTGYNLKVQSSATFDEDVWDAAPDHAKVLGCTPDYNAWTGDVNPVPDTSATPRMRTAAGHIHIGWTDGMDPHNPDHMGHCTDLVKQLDWYLGGWSLLHDSDPTRRLLYGKAGAMRFKPYGVEYRVLSNFWLSSLSSRRAVWDRTQTAIKSMQRGFLPDYVKTKSFAAGSSFDFNGALIESINTSTVNEYLFSKVRFPLKSLG